MKKTVSMLAMVLVLLSSLSVFAGDVPEQLLYDDKAQVFWGTVKSVVVEDKDVTVEIICDKKLKGDINEVEVYTNPYNIGGFEITIGNSYLVTSFDHKEPYMFETTSKDTKTLKLKNIENMNMWDRFEKSLNEGAFEKAELQRTENTEKPEAVEENGDYKGILSLSVLILVVGAMAAVIKKRK